MRPRDEFAHINRTYGLKLQRNAAVCQVSTGRRGQVASTHPGHGHYIDIRWDGAKFAHGPFHPTDDLTYPEAS